MCLLSFNHYPHTCFFLIFLSLQTVIFLFSRAKCHRLIAVYFFPFYLLRKGWGSEGCMWCFGVWYHGSSSVLAAGVTTETTCFANSYRDNWWVGRLLQKFRLPRPPVLLHSCSSRKNKFLGTTILEIACSPTVFWYYLAWVFIWLCRLINCDLEPWFQHIWCG